MSNELVVWKNDKLGFNIRTKQINGEPWFVLSDVCKCLELGNPSDVRYRLKPKGVVKTEGVVNSGLGDQVVEINLINEPNLYRCVLRSNKKEAVNFQDWVVEEVLPSIRKNGMYAVDELLDNPDLLIKMCEKLKADKELKAISNKNLKILEVENRILKDTAAEYDYRELINTIMRRIAKERFSNLFAICYNNYYDIVNTKLHINLNTRAKHYCEKHQKRYVPLIEMFRKDEIRKAARLALAWAKKLNVDVSDIMYDKADIIKGKNVRIGPPAIRFKGDKETYKKLIEMFSPKIIPGKSLADYFKI